MQMPEIQMILTGRIFKVSPQTDFDDKTVAAGAKIGVVSVNGDGATEVKLNQAQFDQLRPVPGDSVAWGVEAFPWKMDNGKAGVSFLYRGQAGLEHVDELHTFISGLVAEPVGK